MNDISNMDNYLADPEIGLISTTPPRQIDFVSFVQNFTNDKIFNIKLEDYRDGYRLIPYGHNIFGIIEMKWNQTYSDDFTLNKTLDDDNKTDDLELARKNPLFVVKFNKDEYLSAKETHKNYWTWKKNRNETRSALEESHGYDTKHAMHLVRLLRMGVESLRDGELIVKRPDAEELLSIRDGAWTYDEIVKYAESMDKEVREVWYKKTKLRKKPDLKFAANLLMDTQDLIWSK